MDNFGFIPAKKNGGSCGGAARTYAVGGGGVFRITVQPGKTSIIKVAGAVAVEPVAYVLHLGAQEPSSSLVGGILC